MDLSDSVRAAVTAFRRPSDLLPLYLLGAAIPAIGRVIPFLALFVGYVYLTATGRLADIRETVAEQDLEPPGVDADPEAVEAWTSGFEPIAEQLITLPIGILTVVTVLVTVAVFAGLYAVVVAAQLSACYGRLRDEPGLVAGLVGGRRFWLRFLGLFVFEFVLWGLVGGLLVGVTVLVAAAAGPLALLIGIPLAFVGLLALIAIRAVFAFAPVAVVVDDVGVFDSLSHTLGFIRNHPIAATFYYVVAVGSSIALAVVSGILAFVDVVALGTLVTTLVLYPFFDLLKTGLYTDGRGRLDPPAPIDRSVRGQFTDGVRRGVAEMVAFVRSTPLIHAFVVALAVGSFWVGWVVAEPFAGVVETSISARLDGHIPPAAAVEFFANNWMVAITTAYAGVAFAVPALVSLVFNGLVMGVFVRTEVDPTELAAFVAPHGIFEIPAIFVATAVGVSLGALAVRFSRGQASRSAVADGLERAFWVLVGIGVLLAIAGFIEGFISPYYFGLLF